MKVQKKFSVMLMSVLLLSLLVVAPRAEGQPGGRRTIFNSGVVRLGVTQTLRLTINSQAGNDKLNVQFRRMYYVGTTNGGVWRAMIASQNTTAPVTINADGAASVDMTNAGFDGVSIEAIVRGYTGATTVNAGVLQVINSDGSVASATSLLGTTFGG